jgi:hypothetical protein
MPACILQALRNRYISINFLTSRYLFRKLEGNSTDTSHVTKAAFTGALESRSPWQCCGRIVDSAFGWGFLTGLFIEQYKEFVRMEMIKTSRIDSQLLQSRRVGTFMRTEQLTCLVCMDSFPESEGCILPCGHFSCPTCIQGMRPFTQ